MPPFKRRPHISKFLILYLIGVLKNIFKILLPILIGMYIILSTYKIKKVYVCQRG